MYVVLDCIEEMDGILIEDDQVNTLPDWTIVGRYNADYIIVGGELIKIPQWAVEKLSSEDFAKYGMGVLEWESL